MTCEIVRELADLLLERGYRLALAESCTGGGLAKAVTSRGGASEWFVGSVVAYSAETKASLLDLPRELLTQGVVREEVVREMARAIALKTGADVAISTSGVCGPSPSEGLSPLTVWVGLYVAGETKALLLSAPDQGREANAEWVVQKALEELILHLRPSR